MVDFALIPTNLKTPGFFTEFDSSKSRIGPALKRYRSLMPCHQLTENLSAGIDISFTAVSSTVDRVAGDFAADGWLVDDVFRVAADDGTNLGVVSKVLAVGPLSMTLEPGKVVDEIAGSSVELTRLTGLAEPGIPELVNSETRAEELFGSGSLGHLMAIKWFQNNRTVETWMMSVAEDPAGTASSSTLQLNGTATGSGTVFLQVAGLPITVPVKQGDTAIAIATAIAQEINATHAMPIVASGVPPDVDLAFVHLGEIGNSVNVKVNYFQGQSLPPGISLAGAGLLSGGAGIVDHDATAPGEGVWPNLDPETQYDVIGDPFTDAQSLSSIDTELDRRWGPLEQVEGVNVTAIQGTLSDLVTLGGTLNSKHITTFGYDDSPQAAFERCAAAAGTVAFAGEINPVRPFQTLELIGIGGPDAGKEFTRSDRNILLSNGIATTKSDATRQTRIERAVTNYQQTPAGAPDEAFLDLTTPLTLGYLRYDWRTFMSARYARAMLVDDATRLVPGLKVMTVGIGRSEAVARFRLWESLGLVEDFEQFKADLIVVRSLVDPNRMDFVLPVNIGNQFRVGAAIIEFRL